jgi:hypothetical protein
MSIFNFTVNCGASPTPTPTPTPTPCACEDFFIENQGGVAERAYYLDCRGISRQTPNISPGVAITICACSVTPSANLYIADLGPCSGPTDTPTPTPTNTPTPTPTLTLPPTATPLPTYTVTVYASLEAIPNAIIAPGTGTEPNARVYYWLGAPTTLQLLGGNISSTSCNLVGTVSNVTQGEVFTIGMRSWSYNTPIFFVPNLGSSTCITTGQSYCGTAYDPGGGFSFTVTGNTTIALTALTTKVYPSINAKEATLSYYNKVLIPKISLYYCNDWSPYEYAQ